MSKSKTAKPPPNTTSFKVESMEAKVVPSIFAYLKRKERTQLDDGDYDGQLHEIFIDDTNNVSASGYCGQTLYVCTLDEVQELADFFTALAKLVKESKTG